MPLVAVDEPQPGALEDLRVEVATVVDDDAHRAPRARSDAPRVREHARDAVDILRDRRSARPARRPAELEVAALVEAEQLVGVAVLLVVVDQPRVRRRRDDAVVRPARSIVARVAVEHPGDSRLGRARRRTPRSDRACRACSGAGTGEPTRPACIPAVLVAPVRARAAARAGSRGRNASSAAPTAQTARGRPAARRRADLLDERAEVEELLGRRRRVPGTDVARTPPVDSGPAARTPRLRVRPEEVAAERVEVVRAGLDPHRGAR